MFTWWYINKLRSREWSARERAARALGDLGGPQAIKALSEALKDDNLSVSKAAVNSLCGIVIRTCKTAQDKRYLEPAVEPLIGAWNKSNLGVVAKALGEIGDARAAAPLSKELGHPNPDVRHEVVAALTKLGEAAVDSLMSALKNPRLQKNAAHVLAEIGGKRVVNLLIVALNETDPNFRRYAADVLGKLGDNQATEPLVKILKDRDAEVRLNVATALRSLNWHPQSDGHRVDYAIAGRDFTLALEVGCASFDSLVGLLNGDDLELCEAAAETLGKLGDIRAMEPLIAKLDQRYSLDITQGHARAIFNSLVALGSSSVAPLASALRDRSAYFGEVIIQVLIKIADTRSIDLLVSALTHKHSNVRKRAAEALELLSWAPSEGEWRVIRAIASQDFLRAANEGEIAVGPLVEAAKAEGGPELRRGVAEALGVIRSVRCVEPLLAFLNDPANVVRKEAIRALGQLKDASAVETLITVLGDHKDETLEAIRALGEIGDTRAVIALIPLLGDPESDVRKSAVTALDSLDWQPQNASERAIHAIACQDFERASMEGNAAVDPLIAMLVDGSTEVRLGAISALERIGDECAMEPLIQKFDDRPYTISLAAIRAIGKIGDARAVEPLKIMLKDPETRESAMMALGDIGDDLAVIALIEVIEGSQTSLDRIQAVNALGRTGNASATSPLFRALVDADKDTRVHASRALGHLGENQWIHCIHGDSHDLANVGNTRDKRLVEPLLAVLIQQGMLPNLYRSVSGNESLRAEAAHALGCLGDERAVMPLIHVLMSSPRIEHVLPGRPPRVYNNVRLSAIMALVKLNDSRAVDPLIAGLSDSDRDIRQGAANALGILGNTRAIDSLIKCVVDWDKSVRIAATKALGQLGLPHWAEWMGDGNLEGLSRQGGDLAFNLLIQALRVEFAFVSQKDQVVHSNNLHKYHLSYATAQEQAVAAKLEQVQMENHCKMNLRESAAKALGLIGDLRAVGPLIEALRSEYNSLGEKVYGCVCLLREVAKALEHLGDVRAIKPLTQLLGHEDPEVVSLATNAIDKLRSSHYGAKEGDVQSS